MTHNSENDNYSFCHYPGMQYFQVHLSAGAMCSLNIVLAFWDYNFSVLSGFNTIILGGERETKEVKWGVKICSFFLSSLYHWYQEHHPFNSSQWAPNSWSFCFQLSQVTAPFWTTLHHSGFCLDTILKGRDYLFQYLHDYVPISSIFLPMFIYNQGNPWIIAWALLCASPILGLTK